MSDPDQSPADEGDLGPMPEPEIEPGEQNPGGIDATPNSEGVDGASADPQPLARDLDPDDNPAVENALPEEMKAKEDTTTEATKSDGGDGDVEPGEESPA